MGTIEKIQKYIKDSKAPRNQKYDATFEEVINIALEMGRVEAVALAFDYGRAKGYRAGKPSSGPRRRPGAPPASPSPCPWPGRWPA